MSGGGEGAGTARLAGRGHPRAPAARRGGSRPAGTPRRGGSGARRGPGAAAGGPCRGGPEEGRRRESRKAPLPPPAPHGSPGVRGRARSRGRPRWRAGGRRAATRRGRPGRRLAPGSPGGSRGGGAGPRPPRRPRGPGNGAGPAGPRSRRGRVYSGRLTGRARPLARCQKSPGIWQPREVSSCCAEGPPALLPCEPPALPGHRDGAAAGQTPQPSVAGGSETGQRCPGDFSANSGTCGFAVRGSAVGRVTELVDEGGLVCATGRWSPTGRHQKGERCPFRRGEVQPWPSPSRRWAGWRVCAGDGSETHQTHPGEV